MRDIVTQGTVGRCGIYDHQIKETLNVPLIPVPIFHIDKKKSMEESRKH